MLMALALAATTVSATDYYVKSDYEFSADNADKVVEGAGTSWDAAVTLSTALGKAVAGDNIYLKGYVGQKFHDGSFRHFYQTPAAGFTVKAGVRVYGGYKGDETDMDIYKRTINPANGTKMAHLLYETVLVGDQRGNDQVDDVKLIYPENPLRTDNAPHVLTIDLSAASNPNATSSTQTTVINGLVICGGQATDGHGGGIYVTGGTATSSLTFEITQCFLYNNYAAQGGGIYVDKTLTSSANIIRYNTIYNNVAGERGGSVNCGGGIYSAGTVAIVNNVINNNANGGVCIGQNTKFVNNTVTRNTLGGIDRISTDQTTYNVYNTVIWGNDDVSAEASKFPMMKNCAYPEVVATNGVRDASQNVKISEYNKQEGTYPGPFFENPSKSSGYDRAFMLQTTPVPTWSWNVLEQSGLRSMGDLSQYHTSDYGDRDFDNYDRTSTSTDGKTAISIGASEYEALGDNRIIYVKPDGDDSKNGYTWGQAKKTVQAAINALAKADATAKGEVWVAAGTYTPTEYLGSLTTDEEHKHPLCFAMKNGISVYGGFAGTETSKSQRQMSATAYGRGWEYTNKTILHADAFMPANVEYSATENKWNSVSSNSAHVVWFAPEPQAGSDGTYTTANFTTATTLDGVTIQGGNSHANTLEQYEPLKGAGVYMVGNAVLSNCVVKNNVVEHKSGMSITDKTTYGGGVYCRGGKVEDCALIANSAVAGYGGGVYVDGEGSVNRSFIVNNTAYNGGGVYLNGESGNEGAAVLCASVVTNNTQAINGAVFCNAGGAVLQSTIANNFTSGSSDTAEKITPRTGGLYIAGYGYSINNIIWNNGLAAATSESTSTNKAQMYVENASKTQTFFYNTAMSSPNFSVWNNIFQQGTVTLAADATTNQYFDLNVYAAPSSAAVLYATRGVIYSNKTKTAEWEVENYVWPTVKGSNLRDSGLNRYQLPSAIAFQPDNDIMGTPFQPRPSIGAYEVEKSNVCPTYTATTQTLRLYVNNDDTQDAGNRRGYSWTYPMRRLNDALDWLAERAIGANITCYDGTTEQTVQLTSDMTLEICLRAGSFTPVKTVYNNDEKSACILVQQTPIPVVVLGGYPAKDDNDNPTDADRKPWEYRTELTGNASTSTLSDGLHHVMRIEKNSRVTFDGVAITKGYAAGTAVFTTGGGILVDSNAKLTLRNCILENNVALTGAAIGAKSGATGISLTLINTVVNNNTCATATTTKSQQDPYVINLTTSTDNTLTTNHVTVVNNEAWAPANLNTANSFAAGNTVSGSESGCNNTFTATQLATLGADGATNFANPTRKVGAQGSGNAYLGGNAVLRPLTSSANTNVIVNKATVDAATDLTLDVAGNQRDLGGHPDLGAYEALLPQKGNVIYVRSYNKESIGNGKLEETYGDPNFNLLNENPNTVFDGSSWDNAIMGNAVCDYSKLGDDAYVGNNDFYVTLSGNMLMAATKEANGKAYATYQAPTTSAAYGTDAYYDYDNWTYPDNYYGPRSGHYGPFLITTDYKSMKAALQNSNYYWKTYQGNLNHRATTGSQEFNAINNDRIERYISGLQWAVEKASAYNAAHKGEAGFQPMEVWVGAGVYTDYKGFVIRDGVKVYGGFPKEGNPGEDDRLPLLSQYIQPRAQYADKTRSDYETILQIQKVSPITFPTGASGSPLSDIVYCSEPFWDNNIEKNVRHYVLYQPDVCMPTWSNTGDGSSTTEANAYRFLDNSLNVSRYTGTTDAKYNKSVYKTYEKGSVKWDGFTVRHGFLGAYSANRDGGAGVRCFDNVELENLIITMNYNRGDRARGGGLYMDGENSRISNSFILNNLNYGGSDQYGGGAYMIVGTGYNMVVAHNRARSDRSGSSGGGGIFIESATFYNCTVAHNKADNGAGISQWSTANTGISSKLALYNTIVYSNDGNSQINSTSPGTFQHAHNCYVYGIHSWITNKFSTANGNVVSNASPFAASDPLAAYDYRLADNSLCLNAGTDNLQQNGETTATTLPDTDMDFTDRVKDCTVDIGAYEHDNSANILYETGTDGAGKTQWTYYVTWTGKGNRSGNSPANAACGEKLQSVLTAAGKAYESAEGSGFGTRGTKPRVVVKVAGYKNNDYTYNANTKAYDADPLSYTFLIPNGVTLMGGYCDGSYENSTANWTDNGRDAYNEYKTVLSAKTRAVSGQADAAQVNGYHTVTFGKALTPDMDLKEWSLNAVPDSAIIDGCFIEDGLATDDGVHTGLGGGAIVPYHAFVRNCVVRNNKSLQGGGLYVMLGAWVSGVVLEKNTARQGGGIFTSNGETETGYEEKRAYVVSTTIVRNTATVEGGGIYYEPGSAMMGNDIVWGNTSDSDKNISGAVDSKYKDTNNYTTLSETTEFYPFNDCFVETYEISANTHNSSMESSLEQYFSGTNWQPRAYSVLVHGGVGIDYQKKWQSCGIAAFDMRGVTVILANGTNRITAGAFAVHTATVEDMKTVTLNTRIFVSLSGGVTVSAADQAKYIGRSFYTPYTSIDAALEYVRLARQSTDEGGLGLADDDTHFDILVAEGTYRPTLIRKTGNHVDKTSTDQRLNSFDIPVNVNLYGSFARDDKWSSDMTEVTDIETNVTTALTQTVEYTTTGTSTTAKDLKTMKEILADRNDKTKFSDANNNSIFEPWEFTNLTILSGDIQYSANEKNVYHIVYTAADEDKGDKNYSVVLDGLTIMGGETSNRITVDATTGKEVHDEIGHGAGVYARNVNLVMNRCRVRENIAVHGAGVYVDGGDCVMLNTLVTGNKAIKAENQDDVKYSVDDSYTYAKYPHGAGLLVAASAHEVSLIQCIFANNEAESVTSTINSDGTINGSFGAGVVLTADNTSGAENLDVTVLNSMFVRNKSDYSSAAFSQSKTFAAYNNVIWGNEGKTTKLNGTMTHCASDIEGFVEAMAALGGKDNKQLAAANMDVKGPRFAEPSTVAGYAGYSSSTKWNSSSISMLSDGGNGYIPYKDGVTVDKDGNTTTAEYLYGIYEERWEKHNPDKTGKDVDKYVYGYKDVCIYRALDNDGSKNIVECYRYMGPKDEENRQATKTIDIGFYEYQYNMKMSDLEAVYVGTEDKGDADGRNWANQTSDLRGAIIAMANPTGNSSTEIKSDRVVYVRGGEYWNPNVENGVSAFPLNMSTGANKDYGTSITVKGACTGKKKADGTEEQNFSKQTVLVPDEEMKDKTSSLMNIRTNNKIVTLEGITFKNTGNYSSDTRTGGYGLFADISKTPHAEDKDYSGKEYALTLKNCKVIDNTSTEAGMLLQCTKDVEDKDSYAGVLIYNTLFADNKGDAVKCFAGYAQDGTLDLKSKLKPKIINCTFANNTGMAMDVNGGNTAYNCVSWNNGRDEKYNSVGFDHDANKGNIVFADGTPNADIFNGPNFADPANEDYHLRPSLILLNKGFDNKYYDNIPSVTSKDLSDEVDLDGNPRKKDTSIDVGCYEYTSVLQQLIFVQRGKAGDGSAWGDDAMGSMQEAIGMAAIYYNSKNLEGYVLVDKSYGDAAAEDVSLTLPGVKIYGGLESGDITGSTVEEKVKNQLSRRKGTLETNGGGTRVGNVTLNAEGVLMDGFHIGKDATVTLTKGTLATSLILSQNDITGTSDGLLYNSMLYANGTAPFWDSKDGGHTGLAGDKVGAIKNVKVINVTTCGEITTEGADAVAENTNNRLVASTTADDTDRNRYVVEPFNNYQLNEDDKTNIDGGNTDRTNEMIDLVLHSKDIIGNARVRNNKVDNGCFETWNVLDDTEITEDDYPHTPSVIYVAKDKELSIVKDMYTTTTGLTFTPGFILLRHHAGLRGRGNRITLRRFAVERDLTARRTQMACLPFTIRGYETKYDGPQYWFTSNFYDGMKRAAWDYKVSSENGAWGEEIQHNSATFKTAMTSTADVTYHNWQYHPLWSREVTEGMLLYSQADNTVRFYGGNSLGMVDQTGSDYIYQETAANSLLLLNQYNYQEDWSGNSTSSKRFTYKENMGWNIFGSPYLCAMNYEDLKYGRVLYYLDENAKYKTLSTLHDSRTVTLEGHIPAFDAVFTQTATLAKQEVIRMEHSDSKSGTEYQDPLATLALTINSTRALSTDAKAVAARESDDVMRLNAVETAKARTTFQLNADGVKMQGDVKMQDNAEAPQMYAVLAGGGHYSLLSAVDEAGTVKLGVTLPEDGAYTIAVPEDCDASKYEVVLLKDAESGRAVNLLDQSYEFSATRGTTDNRFTISFHGIADQKASEVQIYLTQDRAVAVSGTEHGDIINVLGTAGYEIASETVAVSGTSILPVTATGTVIVEVIRDGQQITVRKLGLR